MNPSFDRLRVVLDQARNEIGKVIIGQDAVIRDALITIFAGQHALIEGVPGVAKTLLVRTLARVMGTEFGRIQFTPDLMPADVTGTNMFNFQRNEFTLVKGPLFTSFLLADEINRAPAKTQSALLQAMQERRVTIDRQTHALPADFTVFATQNPVEYEGTYPLPEAQRDRFMLKIAMGYPGAEDEIELARRTLGAVSPEQMLDAGEVRAVIGPDDRDAVRAGLREVAVLDDLLAYAVELVRTTRSHESVLVGAGPRAVQSLLLAARVHAVIDGRDFVTPDDLRTMVPSVLSHRMVLRPEFEIEGLEVLDVLDRLVEEVPVPR